MSHSNLLVLGLIVFFGGMGSLVSSFIGDNGWHLPMIDEGIFRPGYLGNMLVGGMAALASWGMASSWNLVGSNTSALTLSGSEMANAIVIGFGGASWFKGQIEKTILQKTAAVAAGKPSDAGAAAKIASATPMEALKAAKNMLS